MKKQSKESNELRRKARLKLGAEKLKLEMSERGKARWDGKTKDERKAHMLAVNKIRWDKWRAEAPKRREIAQKFIERLAKY